MVFVTDGDTVTIHCPRTEPESARLQGYDAPELFSPGCLSEWRAALAATWALRWHILTAADQTLIRQDRDRYGRRLVRLMLDGRSVAADMIAAGHGRPFAGGPRAPRCPAP